MQMASGAKIWDPLRRKEVALTPEERVRQWLIGVLHEGAGVPLHQMMSEVEIKHGGQARKTWRADLVVYGKGGEKVALAECKRPDVALTREVLEQALRYDMVLDVRWVIISNGVDTRVFRLTDGVWSPVSALPSYDEMI